MKNNNKTRTIKVPYLARVEGEGALNIRIKGDQVVDAKFKIIEPPRFFEAFLRGRKFHEAPDITSRICGICPIAYQMSSIHAFESAFDVQVHPQIRELRRLFYCGEWIESHSLHVFMLHAPDFLGYQDAIKMAKDFPDVVKMALDLKKIGNDIVRQIGGREIHPLSACVGGFYKVPSKADLQPFIERLRWGIDASIKTIDLVSKFDFPELEQDYEYVSLHHPDEYAMNEGRIVSNKGIDITISDFEDFFLEEQVKHSTSLHSRIRERGVYHVGPLARFTNNFAQLTELAQRKALSAGLEPGCRNSFKSIIARAVELLYACQEAIRIIDQYKMPPESKVPVRPRTVRACGATEAPRGTLYHRYNVDESGYIRGAQLVIPTSQNQGIIESDLLQFSKKYIDLPEDDLTWKCEQVIRNYDPCISCSCHFLKLKIERD